MSSSAAQTSVSTPTKASPAAADSPGTWQHPRLEEISRRQDATNFSEKNSRRIAMNVAVFAGLVALHTLLGHLLPSRKSFPDFVPQYTDYLYWALLTVPMLNIAMNLLPLLRPKDDLSDIALTPGQRRLLGLPPTSAPPTPGSVYSTPPRYSRTPSLAGSPVSNRGSPPSNRGSPTAGPATSQTPGGAGLLHRAVFGARRSSLGSMGSPAPVRGFLGSPTPVRGLPSMDSLFGGMPDTPSPTSPSGKRTTVALTSKWRYEKEQGRRSSGNPSIFG
ncbi:NPCC-domain-containing protein [Xylariomycetidae sp. FL0641]|nr:NPCC-domain-containing protein [Xylariomycetidae sp. FL0641]